MTASDTTTVTQARVAAGTDGARGAAAWPRRLVRWWPVLLVAAVVLVALAAPLAAPYDPLQVAAGLPLQAPSAAHPFGTDQIGRDLLSRVLAGGRVSVLVGVLAVAGASLLGAVVGTAAAVAPTGPREVLMRVLDVALSFPGILLAIILAAALGRGTATVVIVIAVVFTAPVARLVRAVVAAELEEDYVAAARLIGTGPLRLLGRHVAVNALPPVLVYATTLLAEAIIIEAGLSFIGVGIAPPAPSWGNIMFDGQAFLYTGQWWIGLFPGAGIFLLVLALNAAADALGASFGTGTERA